MEERMAFRAKEDWRRFVEGASRVGRKDGLLSAPLTPTPCRDLRLVWEKVVGEKALWTGETRPSSRKVAATSGGIRRCAERSLLREKEAFLREIEFSRLSSLSLDPASDLEKHRRVRQLRPPYICME